MDRLNGTFTPNVVLDFGEGSLKTNRLSEPLVSIQDLSSYFKDGTPELTMYIKDAWWYKPESIQYKDDGTVIVHERLEIPMFQDVDDEDGEQMNYFVNTGVPFPSDTIRLDSDTGLNVKSVYQDILHEIRKFVIGKLDPDYVVEKCDYYGEDDSRIDYYDVDGVIGIGYGHLEGVHDEELLAYPYTATIYGIVGVNKDAYFPYEYSIPLNRFASSLICMPSYAQLLGGGGDVIDAGNKVSKSLNGMRGTIIIEGSRKFLKTVQKYLKEDAILGYKDDGEDVFRQAIVLCADPRIISGYSYRVLSYDKDGRIDKVSYCPEGESHEYDDEDKVNRIARKGFFICNGQLKRFLIVAPGSVVKFTSIVEDIETENGTEEVLFWMVDNGNQFVLANGNEQVGHSIAYDSEKGEIVDDKGPGVLYMNHLRRTMRNGERREFSEGVLMSKVLKEVLEKANVKEKDQPENEDYGPLKGVYLHVGFGKLEAGIEYSHKKAERFTSCGVHPIDLTGKYLLGYEII